MCEPAPLILGPRELDDLELLLAGALAPMDGFGPPETGVTVTLPAPAGVGSTPPETVRLLDADGAPLADLTVRAAYPAAGGALGLVGPVTRLADRPARPFEWLYRAPAEVRAGTSAGRLVVPVDGPLAEADLAAITADAAGRPVTLLALVGQDSARGTSPAGLIRVTAAAATLLPSARVVAVPLARRPDAALQAAVRHRVVDAYTGPADTASRGYPRHPGPLPAPIARALHRDRPRGAARGVVVLLTGLSGSGKSTIARGVRNALVEAGERTVTLLDGDVVRATLSSGLGFSRADRETNVRRIGWVAAEIGRHGGIAIACPIAPFADARSAVRRMAEDAGGAFLLVHVATPLAECERRDRKGLYARARAGQIAEFTGISSPYEEPADADLRIDTTGMAPAEAVAAILKELRGRDLIR